MKHLDHLYNNLLKNADLGKCDAQNSLGEIYESGFYGFKQDSKKAFEWYMKAALQGNAKAQSRIGWMYYDGDGIEQSDEKALEWLKKSVAQYNAEGQYKLGQFYFHKAKNLFEKASEQGFSLAYDALGLMYKDGYGVQKDEEKAARYFNLAWWGRKNERAFLEIEENEKEGYGWNSYE